MYISNCYGKWVHNTLDYMLNYVSVSHKEAHNNDEYIQITYTHMNTKMNYVN